MRRRAGWVGLIAALLWLQQDAGAHAGLRRASPLEGATLGDTPALVQLSFLEKPEPSLSVIRVLDAAGASHESGRPDAVSGDPSSLMVRLRPLDRGVYMVTWRVVSAIDGHATAGVYTFGVRASPTEVNATASTSYPPASRIEMLARWMFIAGLVGLIGTASAVLGQFGGARDVLLGAASWIVALLGVVLLVEAQRRNAGASYIALLNTPLGRALLWRVVAVALAGVALLIARQRAPRPRRLALTGATASALAGVAVHSAAGHAASGQWSALSIGAQCVHFAGAGIWLGGLPALLVAIRGTPSDLKAAAIGRFSTIAAVALCAVALTGIIRAFDEMSAWQELRSTAYGRMVVAKAGLLIAIAACGAMNRWWAAPKALIDLGPLRRTAAVELVFAAGALVAAAALGTLPPPLAASGRGENSGLSAGGSDFATTVRAHLTAASDEPGANRFVVSVVDYDSLEALRAARVSLRFTPLDDPGIESTTLPLTSGPDDTYVGSGANLAFDGRWRVAVRVERGAQSTDVPFDLEVRSPPREVVVARRPGEAPTYTIEIPGVGVMRFSPDSERVGPSTIDVTCFDFIGDPLRIDSPVVTVSARGAAHAVPVRQLERGRFVAAVELVEGRNTIAAVAYTHDGARLRGSIALDIPRR